MGSSNRKEEGLSSEAESKKCCSDCKTRKTPLWRSGPSGPKSLCNACGIRYKKKCPSKNHVRKQSKIGKGQRSSSASSSSSSPGQWGEVETAALLLMALSCGAVFVS